MPLLSTLPTVSHLHFFGVNTHYHLGGVQQGGCPACLPHYPWALWPVHFLPWQAQTGSPTSMLNIPSSSVTLSSSQSSSTPCWLPHVSYPRSWACTYDDFLKSTTSSIANVPLGDSSWAWTQASLPVKFRVLDIQSAVQLAPSAFLASAAGSSGLVSQILLKRMQDVPYAARAKALNSWMEGHDCPPPPDRVPSSESMGFAKGLRSTPGLNWQCLRCKVPCKSTSRVQQWT